MKLSPSTIAANLSAAAAAEAEIAQSNSSIAMSSSANQMTTSATNSNANVATMNPSQIPTTSSSNNNLASTSLSANAGSSSTSGTNQQHPQQQSSASNSKISPKDAQVVAAIMKELGIVEYEPRVIPQLVEFAYRYIGRVLEDAQLFSSYAKKKVIDSDDVSLAIQMQIDRSFVGPPSRDILLEIARNKNQQPLPPIKSHNGMRLPADRYSLVAPNFKLVDKNNPTTPNTTQKPTIVRSASSLLSGNSFMNSKLTLSSGINNTNINSNKNINNPQNIINNNNDSVFGSKRKLEDN